MWSPGENLELQPNDWNPLSRSRWRGPGPRVLVRDCAGGIDGHGGPLERPQGVVIFILSHPLVKQAACPSLCQQVAGVRVSSNRCVVTFGRRDREHGTVSFPNSASWTTVFTSTASFRSRGHHGVTNDHTGRRVRQEFEFFTLQRLVPH